MGEIFDLPPTKLYFLSIKKEGEKSRCELVRREVDGISSVVPINSTKVPLGKAPNAKLQECLCC